MEMATPLVVATATMTTQTPTQGLRSSRTASTMTATGSSMKARSTPAENVPVVEAGWIQLGERVEVAQTEEGFEGSHYEATVLAASAEGDLHVEYVVLVDDTDPTIMQKEWVPPSRLRPPPPPPPPGWLSSAQVGFELQMHFEDGWWQVRSAEDTAVHLCAIAPSNQLA